MSIQTVFGVLVAVAILLLLIIFCFLCPKSYKSLGDSQIHKPSTADPAPGNTPLQPVLKKKTNGIVQNSKKDVKFQKNGDEDIEAGKTPMPRNTIPGLPVTEQTTNQTRQGTNKTGEPSKNVRSSDSQSLTRNEKPAPDPFHGGKKVECTNLKSYEYHELVACTSGFSNTNLLGEGSFGQVYKGKLPTGEIVAIKKLKHNVGQKGFDGELLAISRVHHKHVVKIVGYCNDSDGNRLLVYEFVPNKSLGSHLYGEHMQILSWPNRMKIAIGSAKGLEYLHKGCDPMIIHRDVKADNILLDNHFGPKIADFGLARDIPSSASHVSTDAKGTFGYLAPEYIKDRRLTDKSDVYSFGVLLLELITGRKSVFYEEDPGQDRRAMNLAQWMVPQISKALKERKYKELVDPKLEGNVDEKAFEQMIYCAAASVYKPARDRPDMRLLNA